MSIYVLTSGSGKGPTRASDPLVKMLKEGLIFSELLIGDSLKLLVQGPGVETLL